MEPNSPPIDVKTRRITLLSFWVIILIGLPLWWKTTTLERNSLPVDRIHRATNAWEQGTLQSHSYGVIESSKEIFDPRVVPYSSHYKLVFSLLNEDATNGDGLLDWNIESLLEAQLSPILTSLEPLHNFTIESQIQYFAPLAINLQTDSDRELEMNTTWIEQDDVRAFVNNAEWNLASGTTLDPVLHFILYVPSAKHRPMQIRTPDGISKTAFIHPQRGGVVIFNPSSPSKDLFPTFETFSRQLRILLGLPLAGTFPTPLASRSIVTEQQKQIDREEERLSLTVQIQSLILKRLDQATKETLDTLNALVKLVEEQPNMSVGKIVRDRVVESLNELDKASQSTLTASESLSHISLAHKLSSLAYFDPTMLPLLYFPDEHKYAVYTPLFGPVSVPLLVGLLKEFKEWREERRKKKKREENEEVKRESIAKEEGEGKIDKVE